HGKDGDGEGDVGGRGDGPSVHRVATEVDDSVERGWDNDAPDGRGRRDQCFRRRSEVTSDELAFEFEPDEEEEDGQQSVGSPLPDGQVQVPRFVTELELADALV